MSSFEREVDPDGLLEPEERARRAAHARAAHFARLAYLSARARAARARRPRTCTGRLASSIPRMRPTSTGSTPTYRSAAQRPSGLQHARRRHGREQPRNLARDAASDCRWTVSTRDNPMSRFHAQSVGGLDATYMSYRPSPPAHVAHTRVDVSLLSLTDRACLRLLEYSRVCTASQLATLIYPSLRTALRRTRKL